MRRLLSPCLFSSTSSTPSLSFFICERSSSRSHNLVFPPLLPFSPPPPQRECSPPALPRKRSTRRTPVPWGLNGRAIFFSFFFPFSSNSAGDDPSIRHRWRNHLFFEVAPFRDTRRRLLSSSAVVVEVLFLFEGAGDPPLLLFSRRALKVLGSGGE